MPRSTVPSAGGVVKKGKKSDRQLLKSLVKRLDVLDVKLDGLEAKIDESIGILLDFADHKEGVEAVWQTLSERLPGLPGPRPRTMPALEAAQEDTQPFLDSSDEDESDDSVTVEA